MIDYRKKYLKYKKKYLNIKKLFNSRISGGMKRPRESWVGVGVGVGEHPLKRLRGERPSEWRHIKTIGLEYETKLLVAGVHPDSFYEKVPYTLGNGNKYEKNKYSLEQFHH